MEPLMNHLFTSLRIGRLQLPNRILMAPMTRSRADDAGHVGPLTAEYYAQRAGAGMIISEGIYPEPMGRGYVRTPGLADAGHVAAWREVTAAVHRAGGRMAAQIMHAGRISDPSLLPGNATPVAPSAVRPAGTTYTDQGPRAHVTPRALNLHEVAAVIDHHAQAAQRAVEAGFDAVELHAGAGYLPMQFLSTGTNQRSDRYGGGVQQRIRFVVETLEAMSAAVGADRVGLKLTPEMQFNDLVDADPMATYTSLLRALRPLHLAFLEMAPAPGSTVGHAVLRPLFDGAYLAGAGFDRQSGEDLIRAGGADAIVYGQLFIANPDLPRRFAQGAALAAADPSTFYAGGGRGYVDYPPAKPLRADEANQAEVAAS
jgi:N-ethylmaleimide reductase